LGPCQIGRWDRKGQAMGTLRKAGEVTFGLDDLGTRVVQFDLVASCLFRLVEANPDQSPDCWQSNPRFLPPENGRLAPITSGPEPHSECCYSALGDWCDMAHTTRSGTDAAGWKATPAQIQRDAPYVPIQCTAPHACYCA